MRNHLDEPLTTSGETPGEGLDRGSFSGVELEDTQPLDIKLLILGDRELP